MMKDIFHNYIISIVKMTFGFTPIVEILELPPKTIQITLDGTPNERAEMMGKDAHTFQALKMLLRVFARKQGMYSYIYILPPKDAQNNTREA